LKDWKLQQLQIANDIRKRLKDIPLDSNNVVEVNSENNLEDSDGNYGLGLMRSFFRINY